MAAILRLRRHLLHQLLRKLLRLLLDHEVLLHRYLVQDVQRFAIGALRQVQQFDGDHPILLVEARHDARRHHLPGRHRFIHHHPHHTVVIAKIGNDPGRTSSLSRMRASRKR